MWTVQPDHSNTPDRQLRAVIDTIPALVWLANIEGAAEYLNRRWLEYTGLTQAQGRPHKIRIELVNANHEVFPGQSETVTFTIPEGASSSHSQSH